MQCWKPYCDGYPKCLAHHREPHLNAPKTTIINQSPLKRAKIALKRLEVQIPVRTYTVNENTEGIENENLVSTQRDWDDDIIEESEKRTRKPSAKAMEANEAKVDTRNGGKRVNKNSINKEKNRSIEKENEKIIESQGKKIKELEKPERDNEKVIEIHEKRIKELEKTITKKDKIIGANEKEMTALTEKFMKIIEKLEDDIENSRKMNENQRMKHTL